MRQLFALRDARIYLAGALLSSFGDTVMWLAMGIWAKTLTGSNGAAGLVFFFFAAPQLGAPVSGWLVDRLPRRGLLLVTNLAIGAAVLVLLAVHDRSRVWVIYAVMLAYGAAYTILSAGQTALLTQLVPHELLGTANSFLRTTREGFRLVGPLTGAALFAAFGGAVVAIIDAATFAGAAASLALIRSLPHECPPPAERSWHRQVSAGFRHITRTPALRQVIGCCAATCLVIGVIDSAVFAVVAGLHRPPTFVAVLVLAQGIGALATGSIAAPVMARLGELTLTAAALALCAAGIALLAIAELPAAITGAVLLGAALPWMAIGPTTLIQHTTPGPLLGRVSAAADTATGLPQTISIATGAALITAIDYHFLLPGIATVIAAAAAYLLTRAPSTSPGSASRDGSDHRTGAAVTTTADRDSPQH